MSAKRLNQITVISLMVCFAIYGFSQSPYITKRQVFGQNFNLATLALLRASALFAALIATEKRRKYQDGYLMQLLSAGALVTSVVFATAVNIDAGRSPFSTTSFLDIITHFLLFFTFNMVLGFGMLFVLRWISDSFRFLTSHLK